MSRVSALVSVLFFSLSLLIYIGLIEAHRVYPLLQIDNICSQAKLHKKLIDSMLKVGLPIKSAGFKKNTEDLIKSTIIKNAYILPFNDKETEVSEESISCDLSKQSKNVAISVDWKHLFFSERSDKTYTLMLELEDKISTAGHLVLEINSDVFIAHINYEFRKIIYVALILLGLSGFLILWINIRRDPRDVFYNKLTYHACFFIVGILIIYALIGLYSNGIKYKSESLAKSLKTRLDVAHTLTFDVGRDFSGLDNMLHDYRIEDPDIGFMALFNVKAKAIMHVSGEAEYDGVSDLSAACDPNSLSAARHDDIILCETIEGKDGRYNLQIRVPKSKVYAKLWRAAKNIFVLFVASTLISNLFLNILASVQSGVVRDEKKSLAEIYSHRIKLLRPVYTLAIFMEALSLSFLPAYFSHVLSGTGYSVSSLFGVYFFVFAITLIPAGRYAERYNLKYMMIIGLSLGAAGMFGLAWVDDFFSILSMRILSAIGQSILFIAVQSYILRMEEQSSISGGTSLIVLGFNIGTISGTAIGALLVAALGEVPVFYLGATIGVLNGLYVVILLKNIDVLSTLKPQRESFIKLWRTFLDLELCKTTLLIGIPTKALFAGVLIFALPIILQNQGYERDLIGQILIFYSIGILLTTYLSGIFKGFFDSTFRALFIGSIGASVGLLIIGKQFWLVSFASQYGLCVGDCKALNAVLIIVGVFILGLFHGLIHAPIINHIIKIPAVNAAGVTAVAANYRLLERLGHMIGPLVAAYFLISLDGSPDFGNIVFLSYAVAVAGVLFFLIRGRSAWGQKT